MSKPEPIREWRDKGWVAQVVENEDGGGWGLAMSREGDDEPVMIVPWVMGRNKKDPKPLNAADFHTQLKAVRDFVTRSEHQRRTAFRKSFDVPDAEGETVRVVFDVEPDEYEATGELVASDLLGTELARISCSAGLRLTRAKARAWVAGGFGSIDDDPTPSW